MTPDVPTPLVGVRVQQRHGSAVPDVVLVRQSPSVSLGPGADRLGVDGRWLDQYRVTGSAGSVYLVPLATGRPDHGWLLGTGDGTAAHWRAAGAALVRASAARLEAQVVADGQVAGNVQVHLPPGITAHQVASLTLGCVAGSHR